MLIIRFAGVQNFKLYKRKNQKDRKTREIQVTFSSQRLGLHFQVKDLGYIFKSKTWATFSSQRLGLHFKNLQISSAANSPVFPCPIWSCTFLISSTVLL